MGSCHVCCVSVILRTGTPISVSLRGSRPGSDLIVACEITDTVRVRLPKSTIASNKDKCRRGRPGCAPAYKIYINHRCGELQFLPDTNTVSSDVIINAQRTTLHHAVRRDCNLYLTFEMSCGHTCGSGLCYNLHASMSTSTIENFERNV